MRSAKEWLADLAVPTGQHGSADRAPTPEWVRAIQADAVESLADRLAREAYAIRAEYGPALGAAIGEVESRNFSWRLSLLRR